MANAVYFNCQYCRTKKKLHKTNGMCIGRDWLLSFCICERRLFCFVHCTNPVISKSDRSKLILSNTLAKKTSPGWFHLFSITRIFNFTIYIPISGYSSLIESAAPEYMKSSVYENRIMNSKLIKPSDYGFKVQF